MIEAAKADIKLNQEFCKEQLNQSTKNLIVAGKEVQEIADKKMQRIKNLVLLKLVFNIILTTLFETIANLNTNSSRAALILTL